MADQNQVLQILGLDTRPMEQIVYLLADRKTFGEACRQVTQCYAVDRDGFFLKLVALFQSTPRRETRSKALVSLGKLLFLNDYHEWRLLGFETKNQIKRVLLQELNHEENGIVIQEISDSICKIASFRFNINLRSHWPELVDFMFRALVSSVSRFEKAALYILERCPHFVVQHIEPRYDIQKMMAISDKFVELMTCTDHEKNEAAARAVVNLVVFLQPNGRRLFTNTLPTLAMVLRNMLHSNVPQAQINVAEVIESLLLLGDSDFFRNDNTLVPPFFEPCLLIARAGFYEPRLLNSVVRLVALNLRPTDADHDYILRFYMCLLLLLTNITQNDVLWLSIQDDDFEGAESRYGVAKIVLESMVHKLGFAYLVNCWLNRMRENMITADNPTKVGLMVIVAKLVHGINQVSLYSPRTSHMSYPPRLFRCLEQPCNHLRMQDRNKSR